MAIEKIKFNYNFSTWDVTILNKLAPLMKSKEDLFINEFYNKITQFKNSSKYLKSNSIIENHKKEVLDWFQRLFNGPFDDDYLIYLQGIGYSHVKTELPSHYVNVSISFVRKFCNSVINEELSGREERSDSIIALSKILDINLDVLTSSYIKEEKNIFFISRKAEGKLINFAKRFSHGLNLVLVLGLAGLGITVLGLFFYDISIIFQGKIEKGLLATLGSLLMLWLVIELIDTEVEHLLGGKLSIKVFISVAMVAMIRKILVTSLKTSAIQAQLTLIAALFVLGGVYWIVANAEKNT